MRGIPNQQSIFPEEQNHPGDLGWMMQSPQLDDHQLVQALVHEYYSGLSRFVRLQFGDGAQADQIAQNTIWTAIHNRHGYWGDPPVKVWLYAIAQKAMKGREATPQVLSAIIDQAVERPGAQPQTPLEESSFISSLNQLPNKQKSILLLRFADGFTVYEIGQILGMSQNSIQHQLQLLRETLMEDLYPDAKPLASHRLYTRQIQAGIDRSLRDEEREELKQHLWECKDCHVYASHLEELGKRLSRLVGQIWPSQHPKEEETQVVAAIEANVQEESRNRLRFTNFKEMAFVGLIVMVVLIIGVIAKVASPADTSQSQQSLADAGVTPSAAGAANPTPQAKAFQPGEQSLPSTGNQDSNQQSNSRVLPNEFNIVKFDNLLKSPASHLKVDGTNQTGPAALTMALRYWNWTGNAISEIQPNSSDPAVMPYEILDFVNSKTELKAIQRSAGDLDTIKRLVYAGVPVIIEMGVEATHYQPWSGQYEIITGYNDDWNTIKVMASYDIPGVYADINYDDFLRDWQAFNYVYITIYPTSQEFQVDRILGENASNYQNLFSAVQRAKDEMNADNGLISEFFAWFNSGASYAQLNDYSTASAMFDKALVLLDRIPEAQRPDRILWYQPYPYWAYFYSGRFQDVIDLATRTLAQEPGLEESYYWRSLAEDALGQRTSAQRDLVRAMEINPIFKPGIVQLSRVRDGS